MTTKKIHVIVASAGAGKTTHIVRAIAAEMARCAPESLLATTFTIKAADELVERARSHLFSEGAADKAARLLGARFGTVNAVCGQIVAEHAIDLGLSPKVSVIDELAAANVFAIAADAAIEAHAPRLYPLAEQLGWTELAFNGPVEDWREIARKIIALARANGVASKDLDRSAQLSIDSFLDLLPPANSSDLDGQLRAAVQAAMKALPHEPSATARDTVDVLKKAQSALTRGEDISWPDWARLAAAKCAKTKDGIDFHQAILNLANIAAQQLGHPRLRRDCHEMITELFGCAREAMEAYQRYKAQRGLLDFTDQELLALKVLQNPVARARFSESVSRVFVDEFQDSSPLQVAIFSALAKIVDESTWVGDPKQAIYGFRNADSALTMAAFEGAISASGVKAGALSRSYRSRKGIIDFVNAAFSPALERSGLDPEEHRFDGTARTEYGIATPPLAIWRLSGNVSEQAEALARCVKNALEDASKWPVEDKQGKMLRPLQARDVAILCRTNPQVSSVANALDAIGVKVAVERSGLLDTPHVQLVFAALRYCADRSDRLALAELARFFGADPEDASWINAFEAEDAFAALEAAAKVTCALNAIRQSAFGMTPREILDAVIFIPHIVQLIEAWGDNGERLDDLEALRGFAQSYEDNCSAEGVAATPSGLILALQVAPIKRPKCLSGDAVSIMTYHTAKGLEWPLVVMTELGKLRPPNLFEPSASTEGELDWTAPLSNRWIRFWPWPYGTKRSGVVLDDAADNSAIGQKAAIQVRDEAMRLLYVGMTRARDFLVFADNGKRDWLSVLDAPSGQSRLDLNGADSINVAGENFPARVRDAPEHGGPAPRRNASLPFVSTLTKRTERAPLRRRPSSETNAAGFGITERVDLGNRLPLVGDPDMNALGQALHAIFASDDAAHETAVRLERAEGLLRRWNISALSPENAVIAADRLHSYLDTNWPSATRRPEWPIHALIEDQLTTGRIDMLLEMGSDVVVIDHKSFPGRQDQWEAKALHYAPQLQLYADAATTAGRSVMAMLIHMPIVGQILRIHRVPMS